MPIILGPNSKKEKESILPVAFIRDGPIFPHIETILVFGRSKSVAAVRAAFSGNKQIIILSQKDQTAAEPQSENLYKVGTLCEIKNIAQINSEINVLIRGLKRVKIEEYRNFEPFWIAKIRELEEVFEESEYVRGLCKHIISQFQKALKLGRGFDLFSLMNIMSGLKPNQLADQIASVLDLKISEKQSLLETLNVRERLEKVTNFLAKEVKILEIERSIASKTQKKFNKTVRESILRERKKEIEKELGEADDEEKEFSEIKKKIATVGMPKSVHKKAEKELQKLTKMSVYNPEAGYIRSYLDWLVEMPWNVESANNMEIKGAEKILNLDHYGLKKIKERIIEYLAVMKLKHDKQMKKVSSYPPMVIAGNPLISENNSGFAVMQKKEKSKQDSQNSPKSLNSKNFREMLPSQTEKEVAPATILCFVGPPGVGKTSIGKSIARALGREFIRISLGGIRDEAEIRGHRRTYVGALPGRIIQGIKQAGTKNPVFMLDEIDKIGTDFRGDPSAALLEALDPEQNKEFSDHYLEVSFDLSKVLFITTCNILDTVPPALRDRLEIIHFPGYTEDEKFRIAKNFLWPKQILAHGLEEENVQISDKGLHSIIQKYTREAGVRELERRIAAVLRKVCRSIAEKKQKKVKINSNNLHQFLGPRRFTSVLAEKKDEIGMSTGLAWTEAGGDVLFIEVALMKGKGNLTLTGHLGDVMKESCRAAMSYVRSRAKQLDIDERFYQKTDIHIHVPEGAVPKDGPSAGVAIVTAMVSALTKKPVRREVGMTGEITLRGRVLEIGGVKEKIIAAHRAGLKTIILPKDNKKDLEEDIPKNVLRDLKFIFASHIDQVLKPALTNEPHRVHGFEISS